MSDIKNFLSDEEFLKFNPDNETYALIGNPVGHSLSDILHKKVFEIKKEDKSYILIESIDFDKTVINLKSKCKGFNVTVPFKSKIIPYLDKIDGIAKDIGAVNTVIVKDNKLTGYNSDYYGFLRCLKEDKINLKGAKALILGYGGVARMIAYALCKNGAVSEIYGRNKEKADELIKDYKLRLNFDIDYIDDNSLNSEYDIIINATPLGMYPKTEYTPMDISRFKRIGYVFDTIYNPRKTNLIKQAEQLRIPCSDGLKMLVYQGLESQKYWNNYDFNDYEVENIIKTVETELFLRRLRAKGINKIVLIGFMGCGKTSVSNELSKLINWKTLDTDSLFSEKFGSIPQFFKDLGEDKFRDFESEILKECLKINNVIISSGGGIIEREDNKIMLKDEKILTIFLNSSFEIIKERLKNTDRPLFQDIEKAEILYKKRFTLYKNNCNIVINSDKTISNIVYEILKA